MKDNPLQHIRKKYKRCCKKTILNNIKLLINMKAICGILYIKALIHRQELSKYLFIHEIEQGQEVYIPIELSQDKMPPSFRYYDPILALIQNNLDHD